MRSEFLIVGIIIVLYLISQLIKKNKSDKEKSYIEDINNDERIEYYIKLNIEEGYIFKYEENDILKCESKRIKDKINEYYTKGKKIDEKYLKTEELYIMTFVYFTLNEYINSYEFKDEMIKYIKHEKGIEKTPVQKRDGYFENGAEKFKIIEMDYPYTEDIFYLNKNGEIIYKMYFSSLNYFKNNKLIYVNEDYYDYIKNILDMGIIKKRYNEHKYEIID